MPGTALIREQRQLTPRQVERMNIRVFPPAAELCRSKFNTACIKQQSARRRLLQGSMPSRWRPPLVWPQRRVVRHREYDRTHGDHRKPQGSPHRILLTRGNCVVQKHTRRQLVLAVEDFRVREGTLRLRARSGGADFGR